jgi:hypothetical protein
MASILVAEIDTAAVAKYAPRAVHMDLEPGVIDAATLNRRSASSSARETS